MRNTRQPMRPTQQPATERRPAEKQPFNSYFEQNVKPFALTSLKLSGGNHKPRYFSLGNQSTIPFIQLQGSGLTQKVFTWGETIEVFPGEQVQVQSASYMAGDIQIQSGRDFCNRPARITTPIQVTPNFADGIPADLAFITPVYPCDTRQAKRAYFGLQLTTGDNTLGQLPQVGIMGFNQQHSFPGNLDSAFTIGVPEILIPTGKKYLYSLSLASFTLYTLIPFGFNAQYQRSDEPMVLLDYATFIIQMLDQAATTSSIASIFFYVLEYE